MFHGFNLHAIHLNEFSVGEEYISRLNSSKTKIREDLESFYFADGVLDGGQIKKAWFPDYGKYHVFISHSHVDVLLAEKLANWLYENFEIRSFIDSYIWGFADDLLKEIDNKYALKSDRSLYDYNIRNHTTSHVHMMLNNALTTLIDSSECLIFLNTKNAIDVASIGDDSDDNRTKSPWIMSELHTSKIIQKKEDSDASRYSDDTENLNERSFYDSQLQIEHPVDIQHLSSLYVEDLKSWRDNCDDKELSALTHLYREFGNITMKNLSNKKDLSELL